MKYPIIFSKFETDFSTFGLAVLEKASNIKIKSVVNGEFTLSFVLPRNDPKWAYAQEENFVMVDGQLFRIRTFNEVRDSSGKLLSNIQCEHVWYDANDCKFIPNFEMIGATPAAILAAAFADTRFTIGTVDINLPNTDIFLSKTNPAAIVNKLIENIGGELVRDNYTISFLKRIGNNNGVEFRTGKNNVEIKKSTDSKELCTRLYPYGQDDLDITSVNGGIAYLDSQYISNYDYIHTRHIDYSDIEDPTELKNKALAEFSTEEKDGIDKPKVTYEVSIVELKKLSGYQFETFALGDTVRIIDEDLNIDVNARIMEYEYYPYEPQRSKVVLANFRNNIGKLLAGLAESRNKLNALTTQQGKIKAAWLENIMSKLQTEIQAGLTKKVVSHDYGDIWVDDLENPTKAMAIVNGMFAIANSKKENGDWNWRTFGTGDGFTADLINAGIIRIAESLTIENDGGTVSLKADGLRVVNGNARAAFLNNAISMQAKEADVWVDKVYFDPVTGKYVFDGTLSANTIEAIKASIDLVVSQTVIAESLYADKGNIADLTVNKLDTSIKVDNYKLRYDEDFATNIEKQQQSVSDVNYIKAYEQHIEFRTGSVEYDEDGVPLTEQATDDKGRPLYWVDNTYMASTYEPNDLPVMIYQYDETIKLSISFREFDETYEPYIILGGGIGSTLDPDRGKAFIHKDTEGLLITYKKADGTDVYLRLGEDGISLSHDVLSALNFYSNGFIAEYGETQVGYRWTKDGSGRITQLENIYTSEVVPVTWNGGAI
jgi:phage minor structural protein